MSDGVATGKPINRSPFLARAVVLALSFLLAMYALDWMPSFLPGSAPLESSGSPAEPVVTQASTMADLPKLSIPGFSWYALDGLNAQPVEGSPAVAGAPIIQFTAIPTAGRHSVAIQVTGLEKGRTYRIALWVKSRDRANCEIEAGDHAGTNSSYGMGLFSFDDYRAGGTAAAEPGMASSAAWTKVWLDLPTSSGVLFFALYVLKGGENTFTGDGKLGLTLGGMAVEPQG